MLRTIKLKSGSVADACVFFLLFCFLIPAPLAAVPSGEAFLRSAQKEQLHKKHQESYDQEYGGWGKAPKRIHPDEMEYALIMAASGDKKEEEMAVKTLDNALSLLDPVWGGFYQDSIDRNWKSPHYEKNMQTQAYYIRFYSMASFILKKPEYLAAAKKTAQFLEDFWRDKDGAFYAGQTAEIRAEISGKDFYAQDNVGRRKLGMPKISKGIYSRENGLAVFALTAMYHATLERDYLEQSERSAKWILKHRTVGMEPKLLGFRRDEEDVQALYLEDTLLMARAFLRLYTSSGKREWYDRSVFAAAFIEKEFKDTDMGYATSSAGNGQPIRSVEENIILARFTNLLWHYSGRKEHRAMAEHAMRYLASSSILENQNFISGILLADQEMASEPIHVVVVGRKNDAAARALFEAALHYPAGYKRLEWWDKREGPLPNPDVKYPEFPEATAFACAAKVCSLPVFKPEKIAPQIDRLRKKSR